jgi:hypothetical protein
VDPVAVEQALRIALERDDGPAARLAAARARLGAPTGEISPIEAELEARIAALTGATAREPLLAGPPDELDAIAAELDAEAGPDGVIALRDPRLVRSAWLLLQRRRPHAEVRAVAAAEPAVTVAGTGVADA